MHACMYNYYIIICLQCIFYLVYLYALSKDLDVSLWLDYRKCKGDPPLAIIYSYLYYSYMNNYYYNFYYYSYCSSYNNYYL